MFKQSSIHFWFAKNKDRIITFGVYVLVFLYSIYPESDLDWGWHFKYGEYFFTQWKLLNEDIYSWTLPGYRWVNHSWLYDLFLYQAHRLTGFVGLSILGGVFMVLTFWILCSSFKLTFWKTFVAGIFFVFLTQIGVDQGLRSQVVSLIFFAGLIKILTIARDQPKSLIYLVPLFLLWVNLHADFVLGLLIAGLFTGLYSIIFYLQKGGDVYQVFGRYAKYLILVFLVTFVNPYTYLIYTETPRHLGNEYLKNVIEWGPLSGTCPSCHQQVFLFYCGVLLIFFILSLYKRKTEMIPYAILGLVLFWPTYHTRRFAPVFLVVTFPGLLLNLEAWKFKLEKFAVTWFIFWLILIVGLEFNFYNRFRDSGFYSFVDSDYCHFAGCSTKIVDYINANPPGGRGFNFYDWGGYLIGKGIKARLFIDGRMHVWKDSSGYQPFADYIQMYYDQNFEMFNRYDFDWLIIHNDSSVSQTIMTSSKLGQWRLEFQDGSVNYFVRVREE